MEFEELLVYIVQMTRDESVLMVSGFAARCCAMVVV